MEGSLKDQPTFFFSRWHFRGERELFIPVGTKNVFVVRFVKKTAINGSVSCIYAYICTFNYQNKFLYIRAYIYVYIYIYAYIGGRVLLLG